MMGGTPHDFVQVFILLDLHLRSSVCPRRGTDSGDPDQTKPTQKPPRTENTDKRPAPWELAQDKNVSFGKSSGGPEGTRLPLHSKGSRLEVCLVEEG
jgi:hypothetical protein